MQNLADDSIGGDGGRSLPPRSARDSRWNLGRVVLAQLAFVGVILGVFLLYDLRHLLLEVVVAAVAAVVAEPLVSLLRKAHLPRAAAVAISVLLLAGALLLIVFAFSVPLYNAGVHLAHHLPGLLHDVLHKKGRIDALLSRLHLTKVINVASEHVANLAQSAVAPAVAVAKGVLSFLETTAVIVTLAVFMSLEFPAGLRWVLRDLPSERAQRIQGALHATGKAMSGYVLGNAATSIIAGLVVFATFHALGLPYAFLVSVWVGLVDLIPLVGGLLASIPAIGIALLTGVVPAIIVLVVFVVYQELENHLLNPVIIGRTVKLNPLWILLAVLVGAALGAVVGALVAIPIASAIQVIARELIEPPFRAMMRRRSERRGLSVPPYDSPGS